jgi:hypothetical protein
MDRFDVTAEVSMLTLHMAAPSEGNLNVLSAYLKNDRLIYDPICLQLNQICSSVTRIRESFIAMRSRQVRLILRCIGDRV